MSLPLFINFPKLKEQINHIELGIFPTPIKKLENLGKFLNTANLFVKDDSQSGKIKNNVSYYGGNKVRRLEFILADAISKNYKSIVTLGCLGSNCALATAYYCNLLNLKCDLMFVSQPITNDVKDALLLNYANNAKLYLYNNREDRKIALENLLQTNKSYLIPVGGSNALGCIGFVNAALELKEQIINNQIPEPDFIYLPIGSCGTTAGLLLGLQTAKLKSKIIAIAIEPDEPKDYFLNTTKNLFIQTNQLLNSKDDTFKLYDFPNDQLIIDLNFAGIDYAIETQECIEAINLCKEIENINLDKIYTGKAMSGLIKHLKDKNLKDKVVLFWNTLINKQEIDNLINYKMLPKDFHQFFEL